MGETERKFVVKGKVFVAALYYARHMPNIVSTNVSKLSTHHYVAGRYE